MHICIIDMQWQKSNIENFKKVFHKIDQNIRLTIIKYNYRNIIEYIKLLHPDAIIISGSRYRILHKNPIHLSKDILYLNIPVLGICYGFEWQMKVMNGKIGTYETGFHKYQRMIEIKEPYSISKKLYYFAHNDFVSAVPKNWITTYTHNKQIWMAYDPMTKHMGVQFHAENHMSSGITFFSKWLKWIKNRNI